MSVSNYTEVVLVDTTLGSNTILLPPASNIPYRLITFKDAYGNSQISSINIQTQGTDFFEDGVTTTATINLNYGATTFYAGFSNRWMTLGGTVLSNAQIRNLSTQSILASSFVTSYLSTQQVIASTIQAPYISSLALWVSTINGAAPGTGSGTLSAIPSTLSTFAILTSTLQASTISTILLVASSIITNTFATSTATLSSLSTNIINFGGGFGYLIMPDIYPNTVYTSTVTTSNLLVGVNSVVSPIQFYGFGSYSNTVIAELSTGATTQELVMFRGSNATDRIRFQTTGSLVFEPGVSARIWPTVPSNVTPAMVINTSSNVGIQTAAPTVPLDVAGAIRAVSLSTQQIATSSIINNPRIAGAVITSSFTMLGPSTFLVGGFSTSFMTAGPTNTYFTTNVGINMQNSAYMLDVGGTTRLSTLFLSSLTAYNSISTVQFQMSSVVGNNVQGNVLSSFAMGASTFTGKWNDAQYYVLQTI